ncbi:adenylyl-sulfate kinase [Denitromonas ohlonensis]|uniref:Adenylyl-sulfate kinase n=2 Tax=Denitromonas TaxID=139331 RepID=A0A557R539_9RHOO|nr:adenylyl-sulfate kinase [Denitromonas ohlonensis]TVO60271.1 adenylyl-sulfate kinase [Denitromonas ohlonensis]TVO75750.1 adenylyl-sulfate kinase [Denitromonas ohlonensis]
MVVWLIGLSGAGKTTLAERIAQDVRERGRPIVILDGDRIRELYGNDLGHSLADRKTNADRICRLCDFLDAQGIDVVCAILSLFPESRRWCRDHLSNYFEVFIDTPIKTLADRDSKGLYARYMRGEIKEVAGLDLEFPAPENPDLYIDNSGTLAQLLAHAPSIADRFEPQP